MPHPDGVPTIAEVIAEEEVRLKDAIRANYGFGMDLNALVGATMKYLQGKANPSEVVRLARNYLTYGHRFI